MKFPLVKTSLPQCFSWPCFIKGVVEEMALCRSMCLGVSTRIEMLMSNGLLNTFPGLRKARFFSSEY